jgi:hypothetical protein
MITKFGAFAAARRMITEGSCSGRRRFWRRRDRVASIRHEREPVSSMATPSGYLALLGGRNNVV